MLATKSSSCPPLREPSGQHDPTLPICWTDVYLDPAGSHALEIVRHYLDQQGVAFEVTVSVFPAARLTYTLRLRRRPGA